jgi:hypothetical protein
MARQICRLCWCFSMRRVDAAVAVELEAEILILRITSPPYQQSGRTTPSRWGWRKSCRLVKRKQGWLAFLTDAKLSTPSKNLYKLGALRTFAWWLPQMASPLLSAVERLNDTLEKI